MSQSNDYLLRMRQQTYGSASYPNNNQNNPTRTNTFNNEQQPQYKPVEVDDPNSCYNMICETWNMTLLIGTLLSVILIVSLIIIYK